MPEIFWIIFALFSRNCFNPNPVTTTVSIIYHKPSMDEAMSTMPNLTKFVEEISINCENIAANQIKILGFKIEIANPCIKELTFFFSPSIESLCSVSRKKRMPRINKNTHPQNWIALNKNILLIKMICNPATDTVA